MLSLKRKTVRIRFVFERIFVCECAQTFSNVRNSLTTSFMCIRDNQSYVLMLKISSGKNHVAHMLRQLWNIDTLRVLYYEIVIDWTMLSNFYFNFTNYSCTLYRSVAVFVFDPAFMKVHSTVYALQSLLFYIGKVLREKKRAPKKFNHSFSLFYRMNDPMATFGGKLNARFPDFCRIRSFQLRARQR